MCNCLKGHVTIEQEENGLFRNRRINFEVSTTNPVGTTFYIYYHSYDVDVQPLVNFDNTDYLCNNYKLYEACCTVVHCV